MNPVNTSTIPAQQAANPAAHFLKQADDGVDGWLEGLVTGSGTAPSQLIVTGVLGVVPGVGQAMDVRDIVLGVIYIAKTPGGVEGWVEMTITLIGCVPALGDALKTGFKLMKQGHNFGRVLEGISPKLRGNVEDYMCNIDWGHLASEAPRLFQQTLDAFIDGLDSWLVKAVVDAKQAKLVADELKALKTQGPEKISQALAELQRLHSQMLGQTLPGSTARVAAPRSMAVAEEVLQTASHPANQKGKKLKHKNSHDERNPLSLNRTNTDTKKAAKPKDNKNHRAVIAEHITDYYVKKTYRHPKENNLGRLMEENGNIRTGLDHLWSQAMEAKPFIVGETKSSLFDSLPLILALPEELASQFAAIRAEEKANPLPSNDPNKAKPNIFDNSTGAQRDALGNQSSELGSTDRHEQAARGTLNKPNEKTELPTQMSHKWIEKAVKKDTSLTAKGREVEELIESSRKRRILNKNTLYPYERWISLVTGWQFEQHRKSNGSVHNVQHIVKLPDNILKE